MGLEDINLSGLGESGESHEVSEKEIQKAQEDSRGVVQSQQQIQDSQAKTSKIAFFLSKVLGRYYNSSKIINYIHELLQDTEKYEQNIFIIFSPFVEEENYTFKKTNDYVDYVKNNLPEINKNQIELVLLLVEKEQLGGVELWKNLKNHKNLQEYNTFLNEIRNFLLDK